MEGKKRYVAIVLFLLIGLTLFTFANPVEEQKGSKGNGSNNSEVSDKDTTDGTLGTADNQNQNPTQVLNQVVDTSYEDALAAVLRAESTLEELDVEEARDLIEQVTNQNQKDELTERLDIVEETIEAIKLVEELEKMVEESEAKKDIEISVDYRTDKEIIEKVEALRNEEVQESLQERLQILSRILDDNTAPKYEGVKDGETTRKDVSISYSDTDEETGVENEVTVKVTLNGEEIEFQEKFTEEGEYVVTLTDEAFNETVITFTIDKTAPKFVGLTNGSHYETIKVEVDDTTSIIIVKNMDTKETTEVANGTKLTEDATYYITATDEAGNETSIWVAIDTTAPTITGVTNGSFVNKSENIYVNDKFLTNVKITGPNSKGQIITKEFTRDDFNVEANNENFSFKYKANYEGKWTVVATDKAGNTTTESFTIDRTAPVAEVTYSVTELTNKNLTVTLTANEEVELIDSGTWNPANGYATIFKKAYSQNITQTVTLRDKAGNESTVEVKIENIDKQSPERVYSTVRVNKTEYNENGIKYYYVKNGDSFEFAISFSEQLAETPVVTIADRNVDMKLNQKVLEKENKVLYEGTFEIASDEKELKQGTLEIKVSNVKDLAGNEATGEIITNQTPTSNGRVVVYDCKNPVVTGVNNKYYYTTPITIKAVDYIVHNVSPIASATIDGKDYKLGTEYKEEGTHEFVAYDRAGNRLRVIFTIDLTAPELTVKDESFGTDPYYREVSFKLYDNLAIDYFTINGVKFERTNAMWSDANYQNIKSELVEGKNIIVLYDEAGNKTERAFYMDWTAPTINLVGTTGLNKNEMHVESGTKVTLEDILATVTDNLDSSAKIEPYKADLLISNIASENTYNYDLTNGFNTRYIGRYNIYYTYKDKAGNKTEATMLLVMTDTTPATITLPENGRAGRNKNEMHVESGTKVTLEDVLATVTDNVDETVEITPYKADLLISNVASENTYNYDFTNGFDTRYIGRYNIYYTYKDKAGHITNKTMLLIMTDTTAPVIETPGKEGLNKNEYIVEAGTHVTVEEIMATVMDNVDPTIKIKPYKADLLIGSASENTYNYDFTNGFTTNKLGRYNLYYEYTDKAGHTTKAGMMIMIKDRTAPTYRFTKAGSSLAIDEIKPEIINGVYYFDQDVRVTLSDFINLRLHGVDTYYDDNNPARTGWLTDVRTAGEHTAIGVDSSGNKTEFKFVIAKNTAEVSNNQVNVTNDIELLNNPFYNEIANTNNVTIEGNGKTVTQHVTSADKFNWTENGTRPVMANIFSSANSSKLTVNNISFKGTTQSILLGHYRSSNQGGFNTEFNNVNIVGLEVVSFSQNISPAAVVYGKAVLNNTNIHGTRLSALDTEPMWPVYDLAAVNYSDTTINGGKYGSMLLWAKAVMTINNAEVDTIDSKTTTGALTIASGTTVNRINMLGTNAYNPDVTIKAGATVKVLDLTQVTNLTDIVIEDGATVETVLTSNGEMTLTAWKTLNNK